MSEYRPTEYVVDFGDCRSSRFVELSMALVEHNGAKLHERIVRCRDCVHMLSIDLSDYYGNPEPNLEVCKRVRGVHLNAEPDGYCAWAERREQ